MQDLQHFARASDYFLGKTTDEIAEVILHVLEAHLRDIYERIALKYIEEGNKFSQCTPIRIQSEVLNSELCYKMITHLDSRGTVSEILVPNARVYSQCCVSTQFLLA